MNEWENNKKGEKGGAVEGLEFQGIYIVKDNNYFPYLLHSIYYCFCGLFCGLLR